MGEPQASQQQEREAVCTRRQDDCIGPPVTVAECGCTVHSSFARPRQVNSRPTFTYTPVSSQPDSRFFKSKAERLVEHSIRDTAA